MKSSNLRLASSIESPKKPVIPGSTTSLTDPLVNASTVGGRS